MEVGFLLGFKFKYQFVAWAFCLLLCDTLAPEKLLLIPEKPHHGLFNKRVCLHSVNPVVN